ncbi:hypothetical protein C8Q80DRAFT_1270449 [Daedaleopsis nitida]|nr:hypothetical protein C8Q80DRAFT_1270449 [Daedaleopsis nitida]
MHETVTGTPHGLLPERGLLQWTRMFQRGVVNLTVHDLRHHPWTLMLLDIMTVVMMTGTEIVTMEDVRKTTGHDLEKSGRLGRESGSVIVIENAETTRRVGDPSLNKGSGRERRTHVRCGSARGRRIGYANEKRTDAMDEIDHANLNLNANGSRAHRGLLRDG